MKTLNETVLQADETEVDACWAVLRDRGLGIKRKILCWCLILNIDEATVLKESPQDESGRLLDKICRHTFHDALILRSKEIKQQHD